MRKLRKNRGLTQKQLGNATDTSQSYISRIENGYIKTLTVYKMEKLSEVFGTKPWELLKILEKNRAKY